MLASAAGAAHITEVRVGRHATFTRVVFELDAPAGYKIERRADGTGDATSILVTMEASAQARTVTLKSGMVESVTVEEQFGRVVARIHLRKPGLRLKEMILANPPRIVLDVMHEPITQAVPTPVVPQKKVAKKSEPKPVSRPEPVPAIPEIRPIETAAVKVATTPKATPASIAQPSQRPKLAEPKPEGVAAVTPPAAKKPSVAPKPAARPKPAPKSAALKSSVPPEKPSRIGGVSPVMLAAGVAGAVVAIGGFVFFRKRRSASQASDVAFGGDDDLFPADRDSETGFSADGAYESEAENAPEADSMTVPAFGDPGEGGLFGDLDQSTDSNPPAQQPEITPTAGPGGGLFGDDEKEESNVDQMSTPMSGMDASAAPGAMPPVGDLARIVAELERRLNHVETRLDESVEACERLERQMAAQSEELRVQRAAIARTQRALRSLSRSDEEQATEPAIREPR